jgi:tetratricopeptide (TPR) repeat protein
VTRPICALLSALPPVDAAGQATDRECLRDGCRFYDGERQDCGLGLAAAASTRLESEAGSTRGALAAIEAALKVGIEDAAAASGRLDALEARAASLDAGLGRLGEQVTLLVETQQKAAERLLEEISLLGARAARSDQAVSQLTARLDRAEESSRGIVAALDARRERDEAERDACRRDEAVVLNNRGVALYYRGAHEAAREAFVKALAVVPDYGEAHNNLGLVLSRLGRADEAIEAFRKALTADPRMGEAYNNLGFLYHGAGQYDRAAQMFGLAIESAGDSSVAYTNLGNTYYAMNDPDKAIGAWRRALDLNPTNEGAKRGLRLFEERAA